MSHRLRNSSGHGTVFITSSVTRRFQNGTLQLCPNGRYFKLQSQLDNAILPLEKVVQPKHSLCGYHVGNSFSKCKISSDMSVSSTSLKRKTEWRLYEIAKKVKDFMLSKLFKSSEHDVSPGTEAGASSSEKAQYGGLWGRLRSKIWKTDRSRSSPSQERPSSVLDVTDLDNSSLSFHTEGSGSTVRVLWTSGDQCGLSDIHVGKRDKRSQGTITGTMQDKGGQGSGVTVPDADGSPTFSRNDTLDDIFAVHETIMMPLAGIKPRASNQSRKERSSALKSPPPDPPNIGMVTHQSSQSDLEIRPVHVNVNNSDITKDHKQRFVQCSKRDVLPVQASRCGSNSDRVKPGDGITFASPEDEINVNNDSKSTGDDHIEFMYGDRKNMSAKDVVRKIQQKTKDLGCRLVSQCRRPISAMVRESKKGLNKFRKRMCRNHDTAADDCKGDDIFVDATL